MYSFDLHWLIDVHRQPRRRTRIATVHVFPPGYNNPPWKTRFTKEIQLEREDFVEWRECLLDSKSTTRISKLMWCVCRSWLVDVRKWRTPLKSFLFSFFFNSKLRIREEKKSELIVFHWSMTTLTIDYVSSIIVCYLLVEHVIRFRFCHWIWHHWKLFEWINKKRLTIF